VTFHAAPGNFGDSTHAVAEAGHRRHPRAVPGRSAARRGRRQVVYRCARRLSRPARRGRRAQAVLPATVRPPEPVYTHRQPRGLQRSRGLDRPDGRSGPAAAAQPPPAARTRRPHTRRRRRGRRHRRTPPAWRATAPISPERWTAPTPRCPSCSWRTTPSSSTGRQPQALTSSSPGTPTAARSGHCATASASISPCRVQPPRTPHPPPHHGRRLRRERSTGRRTAT
jgi:hypothetical protein